jgi:hypothetical protein
VKPKTALATKAFSCKEKVFSRREKMKPKTAFATKAFSGPLVFLEDSRVKKKLSLQGP